MKKVEKVKQILTTDIKAINSYLLVSIILITMLIVGSVSYALFSFEKTSDNLIKLTAGEIQLINLDTSGANAPELAVGMVPIYYDSANTTWRIADKFNEDETHRWYSYADSGATKGMWANMALVKESGTQTRAYYTNQENVGQAVNMDDILQMYVWIPRFKVNTTDFSTISGTGRNCIAAGEYTCYDNPGAIDISFVNTATTAHDAFTFDGEKSGIWVGKFDTGHTTLGTSTTENNLGCSNENCSSADGLIIKPTVNSLKYNNVSNFFYASRSVERSSNPFGLVGSEIDTHMMKNSEWGAVAYLTQSIYGRCSNATTCSEIGINNKSGYITGYGSSTSATYETPLGQNASTTGTIYGIYDMSGGTNEYVMGLYKPDSIPATGISDYSGFSSTTTNSQYDLLPDTKYYNTYTDATAYTTLGLQHALTETSGWYADYPVFVNGNAPWLGRGGGHYDSTGAGLFLFYKDDGNSNHVYDGFRLAVVK